MKPTTSSKTIGLAFISGAGMDDWIWQNVISNLAYPTIVLRFAKAHDQDGMAVYIDEAKQQLATFEVEKVVVVGHSLGGTIGLAVAEALGKRLAGFVGISATIPKDGGSFFSALPLPQRLVVPLIVRIAGTKPPESAIIQGYCNDLSPEQTKEVVSKFHADTRRIFADKSAPVPQNVPKLYIKTTDDKQLSNSLQDVMAKNLGANTVVKMDTGHLPMLGKPQQLADILNDFVAKEI